MAVSTSYESIFAFGGDSSRQNEQGPKETKKLTEVDNNEKKKLKWKYFYRSKSKVDGLLLIRKLGFQQRKAATFSLWLNNDNNRDRHLTRPCL